MRNLTYVGEKDMNTPVMLIGYGINSKKVAGLNENRYIFDIMKEAFGL